MRKRRRHDESDDDDVVLSQASEDSEASDGGDADEFDLVEEHEREALVASYKSDSDDDVDVLDSDSEASDDKVEDDASDSSYVDDTDEANPREIEEVGRIIHQLCPTLTEKERGQAIIESVLSRGKQDTTKFWLRSLLNITEVHMRPLKEGEWPGCCNLCCRNITGEVKGRHFVILKSGNEHPVDGLCGVILDCASKMAKCIEAENFDEEYETQKGLLMKYNTHRLSK